MRRDDNRWFEQERPAAAHAPETVFPAEKIESSLEPFSLRAKPRAAVHG
jgi:hypothetical protein